MAEAVETSVRPNPVESERIIAPRAPTRTARSYVRRFFLAYLVLGAVAGTALAAAFVLVSSGGPTEEATWSAWRPTGDKETFPDQIAAYIGDRYRLASGNQAVGVLVGLPTLPVAEDAPGLRVTHVAIVDPSPAAKGDIKVYNVGDAGVVYRLCGTGQNCAIGEGKPSPERHRLMRREALELGLYSFKYADADSVIVMLPPPAGGEGQAGALFFRRDNFQYELGDPLSDTLIQPSAVATIARISPLEAVRIDRLTQPRLWAWNYRLTPDLSGVVLLLARGQNQP